MPPQLWDIVYKFEIALRYFEYYSNLDNKSFIDKLFWRYYFFRYNVLSILCGFSIPINTFGEGLSIAHRGTIVVNGAARIGDNCRILVCVNIGTVPGCSSVAPEIGDNVYLAPGVKIYGKVKIANGIIVGANSVVTSSFQEDNVCIAGIPAKIISNLGRFEIAKRNKEIYPDLI